MVRIQDNSPEKRLYRRQPDGYSLKESFRGGPERI